MRYKVTFSVEGKNFQGKPEGVWWAVIGTVSNDNGDAVATDNFTAWNTNKEWVETTFRKHYASWNSDPRFNEAHSGENWREEVVLP